MVEAGNELYSGGIDNDIRIWDLRMKKECYTLTGHADAVASLAVSPDSQTLLSHSHDNAVRRMDLKRFSCHRFDECASSVMIYREDSSAFQSRHFVDCSLDCTKIPTPAWSFHMLKPRPVKCIIDLGL